MMKLIMQRIRLNIRNKPVHITVQSNIQLMIDMQTAELVTKVVRVELQTKNWKHVG